MEKIDSKECVEHKIVVNEYISVMIRIPLSLDANELKAITFMAMSLIKANEIQNIIPDKVEKIIKSNDQSHSDKIIKKINSKKNRNKKYALPKFTLQEKAQILKEYAKCNDLKSRQKLCDKYNIKNKEAFQKSLWGWKNTVKKNKIRG